MQTRYHEDSTQIPAKCTTRKTYQGTNKVYMERVNLGLFAWSEPSSQPRKHTKISTKCTTRERYQDTNKVYNQENIPR